MVQQHPAAPVPAPSDRWAGSPSTLEQLLGPLLQAQAARDVSPVASSPPTCASSAHAEVAARISSAIDLQFNQSHVSSEPARLRLLDYERFLPPSLRAVRQRKGPPVAPLLSPAAAPTAAAAAAAASPPPATSPAPDPRLVTLHATDRASASAGAGEDGAVSAGAGDECRVPPFVAASIGPHDLATAQAADSLPGFDVYPHVPARRRAAVPASAASAQSSSFRPRSTLSASAAIAEEAAAKLRSAGSTRPTGATMTMRSIGAGGAVGAAATMRSTGGSPATVHTVRAPQHLDSGATWPSSPRADLSDISDVATLQELLLQAKVALSKERLDCERALLHAASERMSMASRIRDRELAYAQDALSQSLAAAQRASVPVQQPELDLLSPDALTVATAIEALTPMRADSSPGAAAVNFSEGGGGGGGSGGGGGGGGGDDEQEKAQQHRHAVHMAALISAAAAVRTRVGTTTFDRSLSAAAAHVGAETQMGSSRASARMGSLVYSPLQAASGGAPSDEEVEGAHAALDPSALDDAQRQQPQQLLDSVSAERDALAAQLEHLDYRAATGQASLARYEAVERAAQARYDELMREFQAAQAAADATAAELRTEQLQLCAEVRRLKAAADTAVPDARASAAETLRVCVAEAAAAEEAAAAAQLRAAREARRVRDAAARARHDARLVDWLAGLTRQAGSELVGAVAAAALEAAAGRRDLVHAQRRVAQAVLAVHDTRVMRRAQAAALAAAEADQEWQASRREVSAHAAARARGAATVAATTELGAARPDSEGSAGSPRAHYSPNGLLLDAWASGLRGGSGTAAAGGDGGGGGDAASTHRRGGAVSGSGASARGSPLRAALRGTTAPAAAHSRGRVGVSAGLLSPTQLRQALSGSADEQAAVAALASLVREEEDGGGTRRAVHPRHPRPRATLVVVPPTPAAAASDPPSSSSGSAAASQVAAAWRDSEGLPLRDRLARLVDSASRQAFSLQLCDAWRVVGVAVMAARRLQGALEALLLLGSADENSGRSSVGGGGGGGGDLLAGFSAQVQELLEASAAAGGLPQHPPDDSEAAALDRSPSPPGFVGRGASTHSSLRRAEAGDDDPHEGLGMGLGSFLAALRAAGPKDALPPEGAPIPSQAAPLQPLQPLPAPATFSAPASSHPQLSPMPPAPSAPSAAAAAAPASSAAAATASVEELASQVDALLAAAAHLDGEAAAAAVVVKEGGSLNGAGRGDGVGSGTSAALMARSLRERARAIQALAQAARMGVGGGQAASVARTEGSPHAAPITRGRTAAHQPPRQLQRLGSYFNVNRPTPAALVGAAGPRVGAGARSGAGTAGPRSASLPRGGEGGGGPVRGPLAATAGGDDRGRARSLPRRGQALRLLASLR